LLKNLLENAIQHAPRGMEMSVEVDATTLTVRVRGTGVDQEQLSKMFVCFWLDAHRWATAQILAWPSARNP
jgi:signal transduction histidine kinase